MKWKKRKREKNEPGENKFESSYNNIYGMDED